ncbi:1046_t:CDS:2, partial [Acaulospora morrowiae]
GYDLPRGLSFDRVMAEKQSPNNVIYPVLPPIPEHIRKRIIQNFSLEDRQPKHRSNVSSGVSSNSVGIVKTKDNNRTSATTRITNGVNHSVVPKGRRTNGYLSDEGTTSTLSELSSSDHESSLDGWDNYQNSAVGGSPENNQNRSGHSDNDQNSNIDESEENHYTIPDDSDQDSIEPYYGHDSPNENNITNGVKLKNSIASPFTSSPRDKQSNMTPK